MIAAIRMAALLALPVLAAYLNSLGGSFQFDDFNVIVDNPVVHSLSAWRADLGVGIRPLLKLSYVLNWVIDPNPTGFRVFNIGVHLINTILVFSLARTLIEPYGGTVTSALIAALLFGLHPAQTEAVTYISGRSGALMATFYLGSVLAYVTGCVQERARLAYGLSPLLFGLALATKESAISLPFALLLWEVNRVKPWQFRPVMRRLFMHGLVLVVAIGVLLSHRVYAISLWPDLDPASMYRNLLAQIDALFYLVARLGVLYPLNIDPDLRPFSAWSPTLVIKAIGLIALLVIGVWSLYRRPWWGLGILWFFIHLAPTNSFLPRLDLANDRHVYLADVGLFIALGIQVERLRATRRWVGAATATVLVALAGFTALRNLDYASEITLWEQTARVSPNKARVFNNLGFAYGAAGCRQEAEAAYREALRLDPEFVLARDNLASELGRAQSTDCSVKEFRCVRKICGQVSASEACQARDTDMPPEFRTTPFLGNQAPD